MHHHRHTPPSRIPRSRPTPVRPLPYFGPTEAHVQLLRDHAMRWAERRAATGSELDLIAGLDDWGRTLAVLGEPLSLPPARSGDWGEWGSVWVHPWLLKTWRERAESIYEGELRLRRPWGDEEMIHALLH